LTNTYQQKSISSRFRRFVGLKMVVDYFWINRLYWRD